VILGQVDLEVATVDSEGLRGVRAARDMVAGQVQRLH
jgi:hypothetical protein